MSTNENNFKNKFLQKKICLLIPKITEKIRSISVSQETDILNNIKLVDPTFNTPGDIDLLVGVNAFQELQSIGQIFLEGNLILSQKHCSDG